MTDLPPAGSREGSSAAFSPDVSALSYAVSAIKEAHQWVGVWCPHGMDSARSYDYDIAEDVRELLDRARELLQGRSA